jgi:hypothetical protein
MGQTQQELFEIKIVFSLQHHHKQYGLVPEPVFCRFMAPTEG